MPKSTSSADLVRELLVRELDTVNAYSQMLARVRTPAVRALLDDITRHEKHHIAEAMDMLARFDEGQKDALAAAGVRVPREPDEATSGPGIRVAFAPSGVEVEAPADQTLLATALEEDVPIRHVCHGHGQCGTCRVLVTEGAESLSPVTEAERKHLDGLLAEGWRLACQTKPSAPVRLTVPPIPAGKE